MLKKICHEAFLSAHNVVKTFGLSYRVKAIPMPPEQKFLKNMAKAHKKISDDMPQLMERLEVIKKHGFKTFEVIESPEVLELEPQELERRLSLLRNHCKNKTVFLSMVKHAKSSKLNKTSITLINNIRRKLEINGVSGMESLRRALKCSDDKMLDIVTRNPRLRSSRNNSDVANKVEVLLSYGVRLEDIWANTCILKNQPLDVLKRRAETLIDIGYINPLPFGHIGRTEEDFNNIVSKWKGNDLRKDKLKSFLDSLDIAKDKPSTLHVHMEKLYYLLGQGYSLDEIRDMQVILNYSINFIKNAIEELSNQYLDRVPLRRCHRRLVGYMAPPKFLKISRNIMNCIKDYMTQKTVTKFYAQAKHCNSESLGELMKRNLAFLIERGFSKEELAQLPIILCHEEGLLRSWWDVLSAEDENFKRDMASDRVKVLNRLQYRIEKLNRFSHTCGGTIIQGNEAIWHPEELVEETEEQFEEDEEFMEANLC